MSKYWIMMETEGSRPQPEGIFIGTEDEAKAYEKAMETSYTPVRRVEARLLKLPKVAGKPTREDRTNPFLKSK